MSFSKLQTHLRRRKIIVALTTLQNSFEYLCPIWATFNEVIITPVCENSAPISYLPFNVIETMEKTLINLSDLRLHS